MAWPGRVVLTIHDGAHMWTRTFQEDLEGMASGERLELLEQALRRIVREAEVTILRAEVDD